MLLVYTYYTKLLYFYPFAGGFKKKEKLYLLYVSTAERTADEGTHILLYVLPVPTASTY